MDKQRFRYLLVRYWWLLILAVAGSVLGTFGWLQRQPSVYSAKAVVEVAQAEERILDVKSVKAENPSGADYITTVAASLTGAQVMLNGAKAIGLYEEFRNGGMTDAGIVEVLRSKVTARWRQGTRLIDLSVVDLDPVRAQRLANIIVTKYLDRSGEQRSTISGSASEYLRNQADRLRTELSDAQKKVAAYRLEHRDIPLDEQGSLLVEEAKQINDQRLQIAASRIQLEEDVKRIAEAKGETGALVQVGSIAALPAVIAARTRHQEQEALFETIKQTYLELHPNFQAAQQMVVAAGRSLASVLAESTVIVRSQLQDIERSEKQLAAAQTGQSAESQKLSGVLIPYQLLQQEAQSIQKMYDTVTQRISELGVKDPAADKSPVYLVEEAMAPLRPIWPDKPSMLTRAAMLGLVAGLGLLFLIDRFDNSFQSINQIETELGLTVLAAIPDDKIEKKKIGDLPMANAPDSLQSEAYRTLRTSISLLGEESQRRAILVTSAMPGEGKSRTSANLAISFAQQGFSTLLIDADLRRPAIKRLFFPGDKTPGAEQPARHAESAGLADYLSGLAEMSDIVLPTPVENLSVVLAGRRCPQPAELLSQITTGSFLKEVLFRYDRVVIDSAPINSVSDTLALVPYVHYVCLVIRACRTPRHEVKRALEFLGRSSAKIAGIALNRLPQQVYGYYHNYKSDPYLNDRDD